jgi:pyruvate/2-oxoglutarate dehydrogenase complex dihydrolipoamide acyltransferase (E2) component
MPNPVYVPCVNINDDIVLVVDIGVSAGDEVSKGDTIADVETDKAKIPVEAERDGYVLKVLCDVDERVAVGSIMMWIGDSPDEPVPDTESPPAEKKPDQAIGIQTTAKARALLEKHKLDVEDVPRSGDRLTAQDIEAFIAGQGDTSAEPETGQAKQGAGDDLPGVPGNLQALSAEEHGMASTVVWHRDQAASAYLEVEYDPEKWQAYAGEFADRHKFMLSPLLPLMAYRLVQIAGEMPKINATLINGERYQYDQINLGFTVQVEEILYLTVVQQAGGMEDKRFIEALGEVQRHAMARKLRAEETQGSTIGFSSMARWPVTRHVPILAPYTSLMVAHSAPVREGGMSVLGASYDHRVLSGYDVTRVLMDLALPPGQSQAERSA